MCVKSVVRPHMTFPVNLKLNLWMNIRFDVHSLPDLKRNHISLNLKTINKADQLFLPLTNALFRNESCIFIYCHRIQRWMEKQRW
jgi:hypothetical protein